MGSADLGWEGDKKSDQESWLLHLSQALYTFDYGFLAETDGHGLADDTVATSGFGGCCMGCPVQHSMGHDRSAPCLHRCQAPQDKPGPGDTLHDQGLTWPSRLQHSCCSFWCGGLQCGQHGPGLSFSMSAWTPSTTRKSQAPRTSCTSRYAEGEEGWSRGREELTQEEKSRR